MPEYSVLLVLSHYKMHRSYSDTTAACSFSEATFNDRFNVSASSTEGHC